MAYQDLSVRRDLLILWIRRDSNGGSLNWSTGSGQSGGSRRRLDPSCQERKLAGISLAPIKLSISDERENGQGKFSALRRLTRRVNNGCRVPGGFPDVLGRVVVSLILSFD